MATINSFIYKIKQKKIQLNGNKFQSNDFKYFFLWFKAVINRECFNSHSGTPQENLKKIVFIQLSSVFHEALTHFARNGTHMNF